MTRCFAIAAVAASAGALACEPPMDAESDETLWVGVVLPRPWGNSSDLTPFARWDGTAWRKAWIESSARIEIAVDSLGRVDARAVESVFPLDWSNRRSPRIAPPISWLFPGSADDVAAGPGGGMVARVVSSLVMTEGWAWRLRISVLPRDGPLQAVAFSRRPDEVLAESDVPGLPDVEARLGLGRRPWPTGDDESVWDGLFRFQDATYGVATSWRDPRGTDHHLVRIDGERSSSLVQFCLWACE